MFLRQPLSPFSRFKASWVSDASFCLGWRWNHQRRRLPFELFQLPMECCRDAPAGLLVGPPAAIGPQHVCSGRRICSFLINRFCCGALSTHKGRAAGILSVLPGLLAAGCQEPGGGGRSHAGEQPSAAACRPAVPRCCGTHRAHAGGCRELPRSWGPQWGILKQKCNLREIRLSHSGLLFIRREAAF